MKKIKLSFKKVYLIYLSVLVVAMIASLTYVNVLLHQYEDLRPERRVEQAMEMLVEDAANGNFFAKYALPEIQEGKFEEKIDVEKEYLALYVLENMSFSLKNGTHEEDELIYVVENAGTTLAEVKLKATGPGETKLAVLNVREWQIEEIKPALEPVDYTISVPLDFRVCVNDVVLTAEDGEVSDGKKITYTVSGVYLKPDWDITDQNGKEVSYTVDKNKVLAEFCDYTLTLPETLTVQVNGSAIRGEAQGNHRVCYTIRMPEKPEVVISDYYGNSISYEGETEIPLTYMTILADSRYSVTVEGENIVKEAVFISPDKEYEQLSGYVENLPQVSEIDVAILKKDAEILIVDESGNPVSYEPGDVLYDFTDRKNMLEAVPGEVSAEVDILEIAQAWSLFMSNDMPFAELEKYLIADSYQYKVAKEYATGVDITFTSAHTLANPAFTEASVTNFVWITDNCFSVDVSFVKHMIVGKGKRVDDPMNDRFYFVKYDDTEDGIDNSTWKIASMKEIVNNDK